MIGELTGQIVNQTEKTVTISVGGLGFLVNVSSATGSLLREAGQSPVKLLTHLVVRDDALELYGFMEPAERELFLLLLSVPSIGPRSALAILSLAPPAILAQAIRAGKDDYLTKVSGVGKKSAQKIVIELKDKLDLIDFGPGSANLAQDADALEALRSLGYSLREAREALQKIPESIIDPGERIKTALQILSQK